MADHKPIEVHTVTAADCVPVVKDGPFWNDFHMPCWICNQDKRREELLFNEFCETHFHKSCIDERERNMDNDS
jgi:hypothetical protein